MPGENERVTLAVLQNDVLHLTARVELLHGDVLAFQRVERKRLAAVEAHTVRCQERWEGHEVEHETLRTKRWLADAVQAVGVVVAGMVGVFVRPD